MSKKINDFLLGNWEKYGTYEEVAKAVRKKFKAKITVNAIRKRGVDTLGLPKKSNEPPALTPKEELRFDAEELKKKREKREVGEKYKHAVNEIGELRERLNIALGLKNSAKPTPISIFKTRQGGEATAVVLASDWHIEEEVKAETCGGMNFYNLEESKRRAEKFFSVLLYLIKLEQKNTAIKNLVLGLLGDFISGDIGHKDILLSTLLDPTKALLRCQDYLVSGIEHVLNNSELSLTVVCHSGNHARMEKEQMIAHESGYSLEYLMYKSLQMYFKGNPRVKFVVPEGYHSYIDVYGHTLRFHHGHSIRYGGGVGGITIPVNKAIAQWNKTKDARLAPFYESVKDSIAEWNLARPADIDCFGHFHQFLDGGNFIANGSMIGYSPYAINVKGGYEQPKQALFFIHSKLGHYDTRRILFG